MEKIHVYFMPGLAASSLIFERIELPKNIFEMHLLDWEMPLIGETLTAYAQRMSQLITEENPVLIGVSFGGVLVQEIAQFLNPKKVIIISSVKTNLEVPLRMKFAKSTKAYKLLPTSWLQNVELIAKYSFGDAIKQRLKLYEKYLSMREKVYLDWAIEQMLLWKRTQPDPTVIHIHGTLDEVFPVKNIKNYIPVSGGTHIMILSKYRWMNENLPKIILDDK
ncbi:alpha/beta fold hydrolase [Flavobacterium sp.]|jgi:pimeloyl-ACP methyl ester carboxylesterase|uniref:alpha/beta fold hydrolase n=1 Tax=Flavobacterium sp. TaxID=239 RepID=UPI0037BEA8BA